jgi:hypothetical protein
VHETFSDRLTAHFYEWEQRGRGWYVFNTPVQLEPQFHPFFGHVVTPQIRKDDSIRHTLLSYIASGVKSLFVPKEDSIAETVFDIPPVSAYEADTDAPLQVIHITLPKEQKAECKSMEDLLLMLSYTTSPISFELIGSEHTIHVQFVCRDTDIQQTIGQIKAYFPQAIFAIKNGKYLDLLIDHAETSIIELGLKEEFMCPLYMPAPTDTDPYVGLLAVLEQIHSGERGIVQVLFQGAVNPWPESMLRAVMDNEGGDFFENAPDLVKHTKEKIAAPLYGVCIRAIGQAPTSIRAQNVAITLSNTLVRNTQSECNSLLPLRGENIDQVYDDVLLRRSHRLGMLLNGSELSALVHFPSADVDSQKLQRETKKTKSAPAITEGNELVLGVNVHQGISKVVTIGSNLRMRHMHVIGATGTGKSTFLLNLISEDMQAGRGLAVIDPHGDLIENILTRIPHNRLSDVIIIDPADADFPVGFNILTAHSDIEKEILSSDLVAVFRRQSTSWGDQMNSVFANAILAFLESSQGGTLADLRRFLLEPAYRNSFLKTVGDPTIVYYWQHSFPILKSSSLGSIITRLDTFLRPKLIRNMVAQKKSLNFEDILDTKKILLVKLSHGLIGTENSYLLGSFIVSKIYQAAMARQAQSASTRSDFFFYIDEFQNFSTPSLSAILSGGRKYHLGLILAHQEMQQIQKYDTELASSVLTNTATRVCFRLGDTDAKKFESSFSYFEARDLQDLKMGEAIVRIERPEYDFNLSVTPISAPAQKDAEETQRLAIAQSRHTYGTPRDIVEAELYVAPNTPPQEVVLKEIPLSQQAAPKLSNFVVSPKNIPFNAEVIEKPIKAKTETEHRYLQTLIKRMAESRGYKASLEEVTPDGKGRVDVLLERAGKRIACEVSSTTDDVWEIHNVEKCLAAGYDQVIVCSNDMKNLERIRKQVEKLDTTQQSKVLVCEPQEVIVYFDKQIIQESSTEKIVKGYRVKVEYESTTNEDMVKKQEKVVKAITDSTRKKK